MRRSLPPFILILLLLLPSCTPSDSFSAGQPLTKDELAFLSAELFTRADEPATEPTNQYEDREPNTVYWTEGGSVYHIYRDCRHLQNSDSIRSGTVLTAQMNGKERVCSECSEE